MNPVRRRPAPDRALPSFFGLCFKKRLQSLPFRPKLPGVSGHGSGGGGRAQLRPHLSSHFCSAPSFRFGQAASRTGLAIGSQGRVFRIPETRWPSADAGLVPCVGTIPPARLWCREFGAGGLGASWPVHRSTRALPPAMSFSTSARVAMDVSPGVVMARAPWAAP